MQLMDNPKYTLPKSERISRKHILDKLFVDGKSFVVYPLRVVYLTCLEQQEEPAAMMVSVSKRKFKRAVKRNYIKRRVREAYRLNKHRLQLPLQIQNIAIAFLYLSTELKSFETLNSRMEVVMDQLNKKLCSEES